MQAETQTTLQIIGIVGTITGMFGWVLKANFTHLMQRSTAKDRYIEELVKQNQMNVENFVNTINHNQTKINHSIDQLSNNLKTQNEIFAQIIKHK